MPGDPSDTELNDWVEHILGGVPMDSLDDTELGRRFMMHQLKGLESLLENPERLAFVGEGMRKNLRNPAYLQKMREAGDVMLPNESETH